MAARYPAPWRPTLTRTGEPRPPAAARTPARARPASPRPARTTGVRTSRSPTWSGSRPSMSSQRSTASVTWPSEGAEAGSVDGTTPSATVSPASSAAAASSWSRAESWAWSTESPRAPAPRSRSERRIGCAGVHPRLGAGVGDRVQHPAQRLGRLGQVDGAVPAEPGRGRHRARQHGGQRGLVDLDDQAVRARHPAAYVGDVRRSAPRPAPGRARAGRRSPRAPCRRAAARRSRPASTGPATWTLNAPAYPCACSSSPSRSWASRLRARRWSMPGRVGEPPAGRLEVGAELGHHRERPAGHGRGGAAAGHLGQVGAGRAARRGPAVTASS